jgi:hypothetical protein
MIKTPLVHSGQLCPGHPAYASPLGRSPFGMVYVAIPFVSLLPKQEIIENISLANS